VLFSKHSVYKISSWLFWPSTFLSARRVFTVGIRWSYGGLTEVLFAAPNGGSTSSALTFPFATLTSTGHASLPKECPFLRPLKFGVTDLSDGQMDRGLCRAAL
jgi:hypothetical protein